MLFNQTVVYALRAMNQLALEYGKGFVCSSHLAEKTSVPSHYLLKIMRLLVVKGLVLARKGHHGGFRLSRKPSDIRVVEVLEAMGIIFPSCVFGWDKCADEDPCPLHWAWKGLTHCVRGWAEHTDFSQAESIEIPFLLK